MNREQLLAAAKAATIERRALTIPALGNEPVYVRGMSGKERDEFENDLRFRKGRRTGQADLRNFRARLAVKVITDEQGKRLLQDEDAAVFGELPAGVLDQIIAACTELSGMSDEEVEQMGNGSASEGSGVSS